MELTQLYQSILASLNVKADNDGLLSLVFDDQSFNATVEGKRLVLPTPERLRQGFGDNLIAFHPLSENILRGESPVLKKFKVFVINRLTFVIWRLLENLTTIMVDHKRHAKLSPSQKSLLSAIPDADEKTYQALADIIQATQDDNRRKIISIYLNRGGKLRMEKFARAAVVNFPILSEFENENSTVYGVKLRKRDFVGFRKLIEFILPNADSQTYSYGSNDSNAPFFDALVHAYINVATQLNKITMLYHKQLDKPEDLLISLSWATPDNLNWAKYRGIIPVLEGNDGSVNTQNEVEEPTAAPVNRSYDPSKAAAVAASSSATPVNRQPEPYWDPSKQTAQLHATSNQNEPTVRHTSNGLNWNDVMQAQQRRLLQPSQPTYPTQVPNYQFVQAAPPQYVQPPMNPVPQGPVPPGFGPPQSEVVYDNYGNPMTIGPYMSAPMQPMAMLPPGFGNIAPHPMGANTRMASFGPNTGGYGYQMPGSSGRMASFGPGAQPYMNYNQGYGNPSWNVPPGYAPQGNVPVYYGR